MINQTELKKLVTYIDGHFVWNKGRPNASSGKVAGFTSIQGYIKIKINHKIYSVHRLVWLYFNGYLPENPIDHIDKDRTNNRIENLREVSHQCNNRNINNPKDNTSGVKGVSFDKNQNKFVSYICINKKLVNLGKYKDFDDAVCARLAAEQCVNWSGCDLSSPAFVYVQSNIRG